MKFAMIGAVLITLPALVALGFAFVWDDPRSSYLKIAAVASVLINTLPFIAAGFMLRGTGGDDLGH
jgi:hypothetical protein